MSAQQSFLPNESGSLGISAKYLHGLNEKKQKTYDAIEAKNIRYGLQRTAQSLLYDRESLKQHRVCGCSRNVASDGVVVYRTVSGDNARYSNLITCGSVWACPVCAAKITESRRNELQQAINTWTKQGGKVALMTLTYPHESYDSLSENLDKFAKALMYFKNSRAYKNAFGTPKHEGLYQRLGSVRSLEVTHGVNGWHPHTHDLVFLKRDGLLDDYMTLSELKNAWAKALLKAGIGGNSRITDMWEHGLDIRGGDYAAEYVAKYGHEPKLYDSWSAAAELTKQHTKIAGGESATPFMLLTWANAGDSVAGELFKEFVKCFDGKRMNHWSPGLKKALLIEEVDDETLAEEAAEPKEAEEMVIRLDIFQWKLILETNARGEVLRHAAARGMDGVLDLLDDLRTRPKVGRGWFNDNARPDVSRFYH